MRYSNGFILLLFTLTVFGCKTEAPQKPSLPSTHEAQVPRPASIGIVGDTADVNTPVSGGLVLMGGGKDVESALKWMISRSGGGDVVIIRVSGTDAYNSFIAGLGEVNSVETLKIDSRELANDEAVARIIRNAEMLFIAGGDQSKYMHLWKGTKTQDAINYLIQSKKAPVGGTSAGCAIMGGFYYSGENGSAVSAEVLQEPYDQTVALYNNDFIDAPHLKNVITDQHYLARTREGRHIVFLGRILKDWGVAANGIAVDERTAVCIDQNGIAQTFGSSKAYFLLTDGNKLPEQFEKQKPVVWNKNQQAISVYEVSASDTGNGSFNVADFNPGTASGGTWQWWWVDNGQLSKKDRL